MASLFEAVLEEVGRAVLPTPGHMKLVRDPATVQDEPLDGLGLAYAKYRLATKFDNGMEDR